MLVEQRPAVVADLKRPNKDRLLALNAWINQEVEDALAARTPQEQRWRESLRLYEGVPKNPVRNTPVENAPNIEVTIGAIACDSIYAQVLDLIYNISPLVTVRATGKHGASVEHAKALQTFSNWVAANESDIRAASEHAFLDDIQLGTGVFYIPWVERRKKTDVTQTTRRGPQVFAVPPEDFLVPGGAYGDLQRERWIGFRFWLTDGELRARAAASEWDISRVQLVGNVGWVRSKRESLGLTSSSRRISELYELFDLYPYFDIDGDGVDEDLLVTWDRTSKSILKIQYNPYDRRIFEAMRYQLRGHLFYGLGVLEMIRPYQEETTELHNYRTLNLLIANARMWIATEGAVPETMRVWPNRVVTIPSGMQIEGLQLGDVYPSAAQGEAITIALAERRVGVNELSLPRPSQVLGSRTPGITALSLLQQANRRFAPAFDGMRLGTAAAIRQCLYRYQERLLAGDADAEDHIREVLGDGDGTLVIELLKNRKFDDAVAVELTASSASINRDADRQNALLLVNILAQYYQRVLELVAIASNPQTPDPVKTVAQKIAVAAGEAIERTIRTFDQVRDPMTFVVSVEEELNAMADVDQDGLRGLSQLLGVFGQAGAGGDGQVAPP